MDKITPTVIAAFVIGALLGYFAFNQFSSSPKTQTSSTEQASTMSSAQPGSPVDKVQQALSAAPETVALNATVLDFPEKAGAEMTELKKGTNDWTCLPDYPASPGIDPMCLDKQGMVWLNAYISQQPPNLTQAGLAYMLQGGSDASNTDPFAEKPTEGEDWITSPSHTMVFPVGKLDQTVYSTDPKNGGPWIMWAGTPYEHLMVPVK
ncbi:MAG: hypothetical protein US28_C0009G0022 [Candidatus Daviesbacteria bacterium GW2011_GWA1_36_8]|uniref:Uncharacterized protein n=1 Tax=Candidatus Daviesbacteria bacterium GW2011_GWA1_36_8 TaxID=1618417 RepID=A0A0G0F9N3_9BACT|nr:MAG: hypothetical protein US28_C0009G0022 [Candidatus Daviesbacteria bacterium GW2011_GWA1_36_8]